MNAGGNNSTKYDLSFARWVYKNVSGGERLSLCMQCGTCSGSCPLGTDMDYGPRRLFMMIRAGEKEAVLKSNTLWNCVKCYNCEVRCPRNIKVTHILNELGGIAIKEGYAGPVPNARFAKAFWWSLTRFGKIDERLMTARYYFSFGLKEGFRRMLDNLGIALGLIKKKRMHIGMPYRVKGNKGLQAILKRAAELDNEKAKS